MHGTAKKLSYLEPAARQAGPVKIVLVTREKGDQTVPANQAAFKTLVDAVVATSPAAKLGNFVGEKAEGVVADAWAAYVLERGVETVDATKGLEMVLAVKDAVSIAELKKAGAVAARALKYVLVAAMEGAIDKERSVTNEKLAEAAAAELEDAAAMEKKKVVVESDDYQTTLKPVFQSGGTYNVHPTGTGTTPAAVSPKTPLSYDVIMVSLGMRAGFQNAIVGRTYMIDATKHMSLHYAALERVQRALIASLKPGVVIGDAVRAAQALLQDTPGLNPSARMSASCGTGIGWRLKDKYLALSGKSAVVVEAGMSFVVSMSIRDIPMDDKHAIPDARVNALAQYSLMVADTVLVEAGGPVILTDRAHIALKQVSYEMASVEEEEAEDEDEEGEEEEKEGGRGSKSGRPSRAAADTSKGRDGTGRSARLKEKAAHVDPEAASRREDHQVALIQAKKAAAKKKKNGEEGDDEAADANEVENAPDIEAFKSSGDFPRGVRTTMVTVDKQHDSVLLPILGQLVPFHISTIKSVMKTEEGAKAFLRFNFYVPSSGALGKDVPPSMAKAIGKYPDLAYIKTLNFMSKDHRNFSSAEQMVKAMLKKVRADRKEESEKSGLVTQEKLVLSRDANAPAMQDISMWPAISGRKSQGVLRAHANGLQFKSQKGETVDIIYANVKVPIYQPCEGEHIVLLHFHLKNPILIGKKKYRDVQFYTDVRATPPCPALRPLLRAHSSPLLPPTGRRVLGAARQAGVSVRRPGRDGGRAAHGAAQVAPERRLPQVCAARGGNRGQGQGQHEAVRGAGAGPRLPRRAQQGDDDHPARHRGAHLRCRQAARRVRCGRHGVRPL
jgi:nucleosome binding factor SPN SPT16 subunit